MHAFCSLYASVIFFLLAISLALAAERKKTHMTPLCLSPSCLGWNKALPSKHYSGHLPVGHPTTGFLHYW